MRGPGAWWVVFKRCWHDIGMDIGLTHALHIWSTAGDQTDGAVHAVLGPQRPELQYELMPGHYPWRWGTP